MKHKKKYVKNAENKIFPTYLIQSYFDLGLTIFTVAMVTNSGLVSKDPLYCRCSVIQNKLLRIGQRSYII